MSTSASGAAGDRKMLPRLAGLEKDLPLRRKRAEKEQWLGEVEAST
ncbi:hypothetical protein K7472_31500 [Streptomyces sp. PTM05]|uniref:Uncharacterized protein n=1 Tax=Streptantibioticus parmotrematis TaxID=2873249 RepID=A0ABS7R482_9ACTN|nr:hypothetical protein [Streptantibioticus parmotrematis]MBY8889335.1 hypothetical protein [Streptantibioticus parmotrematis]